MPNIPDDILHYDILTRLPVRSLLRFKSVCKYWYTLINSSSFINTHQIYTDLKSHDSNDFLMIYLGRRRSRNRQCLYTYFDAPKFMGGREVEVFRRIEGVRGRPNVIVGSCNGLICLKLSESGFILCNPVTREYRRISQPKINKIPVDHDFLYGFGCDVVTNHYKVVGGIDYLTHNNGAQVQVYNTNTDSWKHVTKIPPFRYMSTNSVVLNNTLHWNVSRWNHILGNFEKIILTFNLHTEEFGEITCPPKLRVVSPKLMIVSGRLTVVETHGRYLSLTMWVMKEYGVSNSWTKLVKCVDDQIKEQINGYSSMSVQTYRSTKEGEEVLLRYFSDERRKYELAWYNVKNKSIRKLDCRINGTAFLCKASLAPIPGKATSMFSTSYCNV